MKFLLVCGTNHFAVAAYGIERNEEVAADDIILAVVEGDDVKLEVLHADAEMRLFPGGDTVLSVSQLDSLSIGALRKAAGPDDAEALHHLGNCYYNGKGVASPTNML